MRLKAALILPVFLMVFSTLNAQLKKGDRMVGANVGSALFNSGNSDVSFPTTTAGFSSTNTSFSLSFSPSIGKFISDKTVIGGTLSLNPSHSKIRYTSNGNTFQEDKADNFNFGIGGFARNYFSSNYSFLPFGQVSLNLGMTNASTSGFFYGSDTVNYKVVSQGKSSGGFYVNTTLSLGLTKLLSPNTGLDIYAGYTYSYNKHTFKTTRTRDNGINGSIEETIIGQPTTKFTNHGFTVGVGFQIFLSGKQITRILD